MMDLLLLLMSDDVRSDGQLSKRRNVMVVRSGQSNNLSIKADLSNNCRDPKDQLCPPGAKSGQYFGVCVVQTD